MKIHVTLSDVTFSLVLGTMMDNQVKEGFDLSGDRYTAPPGFSAYASFIIPDIPFYLVRDMRPVKVPHDRHEWNLHISHAGPLPIQVSWNPEALPEGYELSIFCDTLKTDMRQSSQIEFFSGQKVSITSEACARIEYRFEQPGWYLISLPLQLEDSRAVNLFPREHYGSLFYWDPGENTYHAVDSLQAGQGYWIYVERPFSTDLHGLPVFHHSGTLKKGWNMIGSVYHQDLHFNDLVIEPERAYQSLMWWNPGLLNYESDTRFVKGKGYWILAFDDCQWIMDPDISGSFRGKQSMPAVPAQFFTPPPPPGVQTSVSDQKQAVHPKSHLGLYPNPFKREINLSYRLPEETRVRVSVYNINGQLIRTLYHGLQSAGCHELMWDGLDENRGSLPSGVYLFSVDVDGDPLMRQRALMLQ